VRLNSERGESIQEFLDRLGVPILLVEPEPRVRTGNRYARELLGKELAAIEGRMGGDVIECVYSKRPGGCGKDVHCKTCTIRNTVLDTFATGKSHLAVRAFPDIQFDNYIKTMSVRISTEKVGEVVLLRIDDFGDIEAGQGDACPENQPRPGEESKNEHD